MFWIFLLFLLPAFLYAYSYFKLIDTNNRDVSTAAYTYYAALVAQIALIVAFGFKGAVW